MGLKTDRLLGFSSFRQYGRAMLHSPSTVLHRFFMTKSVEEQKADADEGGAHMKRCLVSLQSSSSVPSCYVWCQSQLLCSCCHLSCVSAAHDC
jgi:hypothetical protein